MRSCWLQTASFNLRLHGQQPAPEPSLARTYFSVATSKFGSASATRTCFPEANFSFEHSALALGPCLCCGWHSFPPLATWPSNHQRKPATHTPCVFASPPSHLSPQSLVCTFCVETNTISSGLVSHAFFFFTNPEFFCLYGRFSATSRRGHY